MDERAKALAALAAQRWRIALLLTSAMIHLLRLLFYLSHSTKRSWDRWWFQDSAWASC